MSIKSKFQWIPHCVRLQLSRDLQELNQDVSPAKKARFEPQSSDSTRDSLQNLPEDTDAGDFAMEMGLACIVCRYD